MPRITNPMMTNIVLGDMHNNLARMLKMQHQIATNKKYDRPSDNPVDVVRDLSLGTNIYENSQFIRNMDDGMTWLKNSEGAFNHVTSVAQRIRELAIYAGNGALEGVDMEAIATEMAELQEELRNSANFSVAGRYLLGGWTSPSPPSSATRTDRWSTGATSTTRSSKWGGASPARSPSMAGRSSP